MVAASMKTTAITFLLSTVVNSFTLPRKSKLSVRRYISAPPQALLSYPQDFGTSLTLAHGVERASTADMGPIETILHTPITWSSLVFLSIIGLLWIYEESVHVVKTSLPSKLLPVVNGILSEVAGLGFIGLALKTILPESGEGSWLFELSEKFLGEGEELLETFEFLHNTFFEVAVLFFVVNGIILSYVVAEVKNFKLEADLADEDGDGDITVAEYASQFGAELEELEEAESEGWTPFAELGKNNALRRTEDYLYQRRFIDQLGVPVSTESYFERVMAKNLEELVELSPLIWLPLLPVIAFGASVDLDNGVISAASANSFEVAGAFLSTPDFIIPCLGFEVVLFVWSMTNFIKMSTIAHLLRPRVSFDPEPHLIPPLYEDDAARKLWTESPLQSVLFLESFWASPAKNRQEELFGVSGHHGPEFYINSIKFNTWCLVAVSLYQFQEILGVDYDQVAMKGLEATDESVIYEGVLFALLVVLKLGLLSLVPRTFVKHSISTSIEDLKPQWAINRVLDELRFDLAQQSFLRSLEFDKDPAELAGRSSKDFTVLEIANLKAAFKEFDVDGGGSISKDELDKTMKSMGAKLNAEEVQRMMDIADTNRDGVLDFEEFLDMVAKFK